MLSLSKAGSTAVPLVHIPFLSVSRRGLGPCISSGCFQPAEIVPVPVYRVNENCDVIDTLEALPCLYYAWLYWSVRWGIGPLATPICCGMSGLSLLRGVVAKQIFLKINGRIWVQSHSRAAIG